MSKDGSQPFTAHQAIGSYAARRWTWWRGAINPTAFEHSATMLTHLASSHPAAFERMVSTPKLAEAATLPWPEHDLFDYGAERILVVDQPIVVDLLVELGVHTEVKAIIIDVSGYPSRITDLARDLVRHRPDTPVAVLHRSGTNGGHLSAIVALLLGSTRPIHDLGLSPEAVKSMPSLRWARSLGSVRVDSLPRRSLTVALVHALRSGDRLADAPSDDDGPLALALSDHDFG